MDMKGYVLSDFSDEGDDFPSHREVMDEGEEVDPDNNDLNYDDDDIPTPKCIKSNLGSNEMTLISSSDDEEQQLDNKDNMRHESGLSDKEPPVSKVLGCEKNISEEDCQIKDIEEGEILSDSDDDVPEIKGGISPKLKDKPDDHYSSIVYHTPTPMKFTLNRVEATCKFFIRGSCTWGDSCKFYHPKEIHSERDNIQIFGSNQIQTPGGLISPGPLFLSNQPPPPIFPLITPPLPLLSIFAPLPMPVPIPPQPQYQIKEEPTNAWERGLRQARVILKKGGQGLSSSKEKALKDSTEQLIPIDSPEGSQISSRSSSIERQDNITKLLSQQDDIERSSSKSPELITYLPDDPTPLNLEESNSPQNEEGSSNYECSRHDINGGRNALGSNSYSDPWARNNHSISKSNSSYAKSSNSTRSAKRRRSSSTSSSHPTIPDDSESFEKINHSNENKRLKRDSDNRSSPSHFKRRSRQNYRTESSSHQVGYSHSGKPSVCRNMSQNLRTKNYKNRRNNNRREERSKASYDSNQNDVEKFFELNDDDVPAVYRLNTNIAPEENHRHRSKSSSSDSSSGSSTSSRSESDTKKLVNYRSPPDSPSSGKMGSDKASSKSLLKGSLSSASSLNDSDLSHPEKISHETTKEVEAPHKLEQNLSEHYFTPSKSEQMDEKSRKREELLRELKAVEEAIFQATKKGQKI